MILSVNVYEFCPFFSLSQVAYNRVMMSTTHRAVTRVKDVKFRRINKAKSRSLEELRGRLKEEEEEEEEEETKAR